MFLIINANAKSHTHCQVAKKASRTGQNLAISMSLPTLTERLEKESTYPQQKIYGIPQLVVNMYIMFINLIYL